MISPGLCIFPGISLFFSLGLCLNSFFLHVDIQLFQSYFLKSLYLLHCIAWSPLSKISWLYLWGFTLGLSILYHCSVCLFFHQYNIYCINLDFCIFIVSLKLGSVSPSNFFLYSVRSILGLLSHHINFKINLLLSTKLLVGIWLWFPWIYRSSWKNLHLDNIESSYLWTWNSCPFI